MKKATKRYLTVFLLVATCIAMLIAMGMATRKKVFASADTEPCSIAEPYAITQQTGLGLGINVVKATQADDFVTGYSILDPERISEIPTSKITRNKNVSYTHSTTLINNIINDYKLTFNLGGEVSAFLGSLKADLKTNLDIELEKYTYKFYNVMEQNITRYKLYLNDYLDAKTYVNYFSNNFLVDLANVAKTRKYNPFFDKYGTHIVGSANFGGKITASYTLASNKVILNEDISTVIEAKVKLDKLSEDISGDIATELGKYFSASYETSDLKTAFYVNAIGGDAFASGSIKDFNEGYSAWAKSFNGNDNNSVVMDYGSDGLVPLWEVLPAPYNTLSDDMQEAFNEYYKDFMDNIIEEFKTSNNTTAFAGGSGSKDDPFLIANVQQLKNIESISMCANYKLHTDTDNDNDTDTDTDIDIDLKEDDWSPIGGLYMAKPFKGTLDGAGKKIINLTRTGNITASDNRYYFGLFGYIGLEGTVKNLTLDKVKIHVTGPKSGTASTRIFIGAVAGIVKGTVENVVVNGECFYDVCVKGTSHVGGIAGCAYTGAKIINCTNNAAVTSARYSSSAGGILGYSAGAIIRGCTNTGSILSKCTGWGGYAGAGGIVGNAYEGKDDKDITIIISCTNLGKYDCAAYQGGLTKYYSKDEMIGREVSDFYKTL